MENMKNYMIALGYTTAVRPCIRPWKYKSTVLNTYARCKSPEVWFLTIIAMFLSEAFQRINASVFFGICVSIRASFSVNMLYTLRI